ncbi:MAG: hypothetical protein P1U74_10505 [Legionellaceae bacterium]|nr:hypothetical protein [Legionellaceae bacterium]
MQTLEELANIEIAELKSYYSKLSSIKKKLLFPDELGDEIENYNGLGNLFSLISKLLKYKNAWFLDLKKFSESQVVLLYENYQDFLEANILEYERDALFSRIVRDPNPNSVCKCITEYCIRHNYLYHLKPPRDIYLDYCEQFLSRETLVDEDISRNVDYLKKHRELSLANLFLLKERVTDAVVKYLAERSFDPLLVEAIILLSAELCLDGFYVNIVVTHVKPSAAAIALNFIHEKFSLLESLDTKKTCVDFIQNIEEDGCIRGYDVISAVKLRYSQVSLKPGVDEIFQQKFIKHAHVIFTERTDIIWRSVPNWALIQIYQYLFEACELEDSPEDKEPMIIDVMLELEEILLSREILLSGEYDEYMEIHLRVALLAMGVDLDSYRCAKNITDMEINAADEESYFKLILVMMRKNIPSINNIIISFCSRENIKAKFNCSNTNGQGDLTGADILKYAKDNNYELYAPLKKLTFAKPAVVSIATVSCLNVGGELDMKQSEELQKSSLSEHV